MGQWYEETEDGIVKVRTCAWSPPGDHPVGCGLYLHVKDGKVVKVEGDPDHPISQGRLCIRCLTLPEYLYHEDRVIYPMKRAKEDRGKDKWERITWDEALELAVAKRNEIAEKYGPESILVFKGTGREATLYAPAMAYACLGTPNCTFAMSGSACYGPRCGIADFILGAGYPELDYAAFFPDRYDDPRYEVPKYIILWGKDPLASNPDGFFGHALVDLMKRGSKFITIDPRVTWIGARSEYHLQLRPGTDAAIGLGLLNVVISEDLYDHEFVDKWCFGFEALKERAAQYTPEIVEAITWVPAETLVGAARAFATNSPSSIMWGLAIDTETNGVQAGHALLALIAITGNYDVPGGVTLAVPGSFMGKWRYDCAQLLPPDLWAKRIVDENYPGFRVNSSYAHPDSVLDTLETDQPYPLRMGWVVGANPLAPTSSAQPKRWHDALLKTMEFFVVQDCFMTPTAMAVADLFLPTSTFAEHDGVVLPHFGRNTHFLGSMNKAVEIGECKSDIEICMEVGKRVFPDAWPWETVQEFFTDQIKPSMGLTFEDVRESELGMVPTPFEYRKYEKGLLRADGLPGFNTPTGLIELKSSVYPDLGEDALPYYEEPMMSPYSEEHPEWAEEYPLIFTSGGREFTSFHSEHRQIPSLRKLMKDPIVQIHPDTAAQYGIEEGDWVCMENPFGKAVERAHLTKILDPRVVHAQHGWWYPEQDGEEPNLYGVWKSNVNNLIPHFNVGRLGYGAPYKNVICKIYKVDGLDAANEE